MFSWLLNHPLKVSEGQVLKGYVNLAIWIAVAWLLLRWLKSR